MRNVRCEYRVSRGHCELPVSALPILHTDHEPPAFLLPHPYVILSNAKDDMLKVMIPIGFLKRSEATKQSRFSIRQKIRECVVPKNAPREDELNTKRLGRGTKPNIAIFAEASWASFLSPTYICALIESTTILNVQRRHPHTHLDGIMSS